MTESLTFNFKGNSFVPSNEDKQSACLLLIHVRKQEEYKTSCWLVTAFPVVMLGFCGCTAVF